jgi:hypothetical protein
MNSAARLLALFAVAGHIGVSVSSAVASTGDLAVRTSLADRPSLGVQHAEAAGVRVAQSSPGNGSSGGNGGGDGGGSTGGHGGGPSPSSNWGSSSSTSGACGLSIWMPDPNAAASAVDGVEQVSRAAKGAIEFCGCSTQACIADQLDEYADDLDKAINRKPDSAAPGGPAEKPVPRAVRDLPKIVHDIARKVRAAPTVKAAVQLVEGAIKLVHKTIELARAPDPDTKSEITRGGEAVADTLKTAADTLARADTL